MGAFSSDFTTAAGKTARPWKTTKVYTEALNWVKSGDRVIDYGSGPYQTIRPAVENLGATYVPFDRYGDIGSVADLSNADVVMGSNVLNVAVKADDSRAAYDAMLTEMISALKPGGVLVVNMPSSGPSADWMSPAQLKTDLQTLMTDVIRKGQVVVARKAGNGITEVTLKQLRLGIDGLRKERSKPVICRLVSLSDDGVVSFYSSSVTVWPGKRDAYVNHIRLMDWKPALEAQGLTYQERANLAVFGDVKVSCSCGSFLYHGFKYILTQLDALFPAADWEGTTGQENRFPKVRNKNLTGVVCKHLDTVLYVLTMSVSVISSLMKKKVESGNISVNVELPDEPETDDIEPEAEETTEETPPEDDTESDDEDEEIEDEDENNRP